MEVLITSSKVAELNKKLSALLPEQGRSAFANLTVRRLPTEKISHLREMSARFNRLISESKFIDKIQIPYADFELMITVINDEDNKL